MAEALILRLPAPCPLCGAMLQRINAGSPYGEGRGVAPHYEMCHPEVRNIPVVAG